MVKKISLIIYLLAFFSFFWSFTPSQGAEWFGSECDYTTVTYGCLPSVTLGSLIRSNPTNETPILRDCLAYELGKAKNGVMLPSTPQEILQFFTIQELVQFIKKPETTEKGETSTFLGLYGIEHLTHGPVDDKAINLIKTLLKEGSVNFFDFGAGYGLFVKKVIEACELDLNKLSVSVNECLSPQCYAIAQLFEKYEGVKIYPRDILGGLDYNKIEKQITLSTIFNVHHFMTPFRFKSSLRNVYRVTERGGYHIAVAMSPYHLGDDSLIAKEYARRLTAIEEYREYPGYFIDRDILNMGLSLLSVRTPLLLLSQETYTNAFQDAGFTIEESGYFSADPKCPRAYSYIIGRKP